VAFRPALWCAPSFTAGSNSKEIRKGRLCPIGKIPNADGSRDFSARGVSLEWRREDEVVTDSPRTASESIGALSPPMLLGQI
jgi:hypothetical protein